MEKPNSKQVLIRVPDPLLKRVDASAKSQSRSRTAEVCILLSDALKSKKASKARAKA